ncbi:MAG: glycosyltransferase family 9 protein [Armatimonadota bacterium]
MNIVCFHLNQLGDLMFSLPALRSLRDSLPDARITSVVRPELRELLEWSMLTDRILTRNGKKGLHPLKLALALRKSRYDLTILFSQSAGCAWLAYATGAPRRIGFINTSLGWLLTEHVPFVHPPSTSNNLRLIEALGITPTRTDYSGILRVPQEALDRASRLLAFYGISEFNRLVALAPETSKRRKLKEWTDEGFAEVARHLIKNGFQVVVLGAIPSPRITHICKEVTDTGGKTSIADVAGILAQCKLLIGVDSGIIHLCAAIGKPVIGLYGPTDPKITGPQGKGHTVISLGLECSPCGLSRCNHNRRCMTQIDPNSVIAATEKLLSDK